MLVLLLFVYYSFDINSCYGVDLILFQNLLICLHSVMYIGWAKG